MEALIDLQNTDYPGELVSDDTVAKIREAVRLYRDIVDEEVAANQELALLYKRVAKYYMEIGALNQRIAALGMPVNTVTSAGDEYYYKLLALQSLNNQLYSKAFDSLQEAIRIDRRNPILYYLSAVCAGWIGTSSPGDRQDSLRVKWLKKAEEYYTKAIELKPGYSDALYGLAVLLLFEYEGRQDEAAGYVEQILKIETRNTDAMFLLGRIYAQQAEYAKAAAVYQEIMTLVESTVTADRARELKGIVEDRLYASQ